MPQGGAQLSSLVLLYCCGYTLFALLLDVLADEDPKMMICHDAESCIPTATSLPAYL